MQLGMAITYALNRSIRLAFFNFFLLDLKKFNRTRQSSLEILFNDYALKGSSRYSYQFSESTVVEHSSSFVIYVSSSFHLKGFPLELSSCI